MDNRIFNVNGDRQTQFNLALDLLLNDDLSVDINEFKSEYTFGRIGTSVRGYKFTYNKGLILYWYLDDKLEKNGVKNIEDLIDKYLDKEKYSLLLRKYKLLKMDKKFKKRVGIPSDILKDILWNWLINFDEYDKILFTDWEYNAVHDGSNSRGFRIYTEDWGQVNSDVYSIAAIKPVYTWYGK